MPRLATALALALLASAPPLASAAESLGVTPADLLVPGAQRGETYVRDVTLQNQFDTPSTFVVEREGETGAWSRTEPPTPIVVPARDEVRVRVVVEVPPEAENGVHEGALRFVGEAKSRPDGSGFALRHAVAVPLRVELGGPQEVRLRYLDLRVADVEAGTPPVVLVSVVNDGNVRTDAHASVGILDPAGKEVARAENATRVRPGERATLAVPIDDVLPLGGYRAVATLGDGSPLSAFFKVVPVGTLGKEGTLRYLRHEPSVVAGLPVRVEGVFENSGDAAIARARLAGEVWRGDQLVATFASDDLAVAPGDTVALVAYFTSPTDGELRLVAHVVYDGFRTPPNEGILVAGAATEERGAPWPLLVFVALAAAAAVATLALRRR